MRKSYSLSLQLRRVVIELHQPRRHSDKQVALLTHLPRSVADAETITQLYLKRWNADTTSHAGKMIMTIFTGIAEFERDLIRERTSVGREAAMKRGVKFGCPKKLSPEQKELILKLREEGKSTTELAKTFNVDRSTI